MEEYTPLSLERHSNWLFLLDLRSGVPQVALDLADQNLYGRTPGDVKKVSKTKKSSLLRGLGSVFR